MDWAIPFAVVIPAEAGIQSKYAGKPDLYMMVMVFPIGSTFMSRYRKMPSYEACMQMSDLLAEGNRCSGFLPPQE